ncbi:FkbM family methyltransferase [Mycobacterium simiae]|uniref:FkbM family methyltransferase n=1 Tax=Mycobacterium simiae TaxID=1784 RepID=A0A5B1BRW7_MYCSI|nr:FkbM family methyltransferase [Mycobacterium simiae]
MLERLPRSLRRPQRWLPGGLAPWHWRDLKVTLEPGSTIAWVARMTGGFEEAEIDIAAALNAALYPGRCILDVGANVGLHSLAWARLAPVVALEPAPGTFAQLEANVAANGLQGRVRTLRMAAGDAADGEVEFFVAADSAFSSLKDTGRKRIRERILVPCTTLDALAAELGLSFGLLKIDVEGLERAVIAGAAELLRRDHPVLLVEIYGGVASNPEPERTVENICAFGYEPFVYSHDVGLLPYEQHRDDRYNYFFLPRPPM